MNAIFTAQPSPTAALSTGRTTLTIHTRQACTSISGFSGTARSGRTQTLDSPYSRLLAPIYTSRPTPRAHQRRPVITHASSGSEIVEVEELKGIRVLKEEDGRPRIEYLVQWKDGSPDTWEPAANMADDLLRDFEDRWWSAVRKGNEEIILKMLEGGGPTLARTVDDSRRSALHFAAALGRANVVKKLLEAGAEVDLADKEGYTPLHMAAGYLHTSTITALLEGGADPEQQDRQERSPLELVESLRAAMPADNPQMVARRVALEDVLKVLTDNLFEDVEPAAVLEARQVEGEGALEGDKEFLVKFPDEEEPVWLPARYVSEEVASDFESGLEYAEAQSIVDVRNRGDSRTYLVRWGDGYPDSWEPEENVSQDLIKVFEAGGDEAAVLKEMREALEKAAEAEGAQRAAQMANA